MPGSVEFLVLIAFKVAIFEAAPREEADGCDVAQHVDDSTAELAMGFGMLIGYSDAAATEQGGNGKVEAKPAKEKKGKKPVHRHQQSRRQKTLKDDWDNRMDHDLKDALKGARHVEQLVRQRYNRKLWIVG